MRHGRYRFLAGAMIPPLLLYGVFVLSPYAQAFYLAFTDWNGLSGQANLVGLENFGKLWSDPLFLAALRHNGLMLLVVPLVTIGLALFFAAMLGTGEKRRAASAYRIVYFFPQLLSVAIIAVLWQFVYTPNSGLLNGLLSGIGLPGLRRSWLAEPDLAIWAVMATMIWAAVGFYVVLFSAAMESIPADVLEAALLDGAGRMTTFRRITLPLVWDSVQVAWIYLGVAALDGFALVQIMTVGPGGPDNSTEVMGLSLYRNAFTYGKFGYASAMGVALFFLTLTLAVLLLRVSRRERVELS
ncbi:N-acetylglucosamine transport system permease protein [Allocatelliglobosispora scoriae]|uniref:N-acetylglucosamine transport system permease protein n=1 Tax=Allocatelliglobosispora scoriae TaxID=643052 RepID=A0A841BPL2_9ACTN|nr:sugar ABC transporter permease [Allocatelliglobosispora scoriae]MBB5869129.1 N-acetylglucosamine transport system permease protein [Allocatelliglobosispora scoriae]